MKAHIKMEKTIIKFDDIDIQKQTFHQHKGLILIKNIDINKIVLSEKVSFGKKRFEYFIDHKDAKNFRPLCIFLPKLKTYRKNFDETKYMSFLIKDHELLEKHNKIWEKVINNLGKEFDSEPVYNEKCVNIY